VTHHAAYTYKADGVTYVHKSLSAQYAHIPVCGFIGDGESLHGDLEYVTCPDCLVASLSDTTSELPELCWYDTSHAVATIKVLGQPTALCQRDLDEFLGAS
jgi:hypothetical protein